MNGVGKWIATKVLRLPNEEHIEEEHRCSQQERERRKEEREDAEARQRRITSRGEELKTFSERAEAHGLNEEAYMKAMGMYKGGDNEEVRNDPED